MREKFDFNISERISAAAADLKIVFHAKLTSEGEYLVTWESEELSMCDGGVVYFIDEVRECLENGDWILIK